MERIIRDRAGLGKHGFASYNAQTNKALGTSQQGTSQLGEPPGLLPATNVATSLLVICMPPGPGVRRNNELAEFICESLRAPLRPMIAQHKPLAVGAMAHLMTIAVIAFIGICTAAQFWRSDLNWIAIPLSAYLTGPGGVYVRAVYYLVAIALLGFAWASYAVTASMQRSRLASTLFAAAGFALPVVAITELFRGTPYEDVAHLIHQITAPATFLWLSFGMLLLSHRWRRDPHMKKGNQPGIALAWLITFVLWFQLLVPVLPSGLMEKLAIVLILLWLGWAARHLLHATRSLDHVRG